MNSGAPASKAPPDFSSLGMMASQSVFRVSYWCREKYFGVYFPADAAFSFCTIWCASAAASAGIICSTEPPAAPRARFFRTSRREIPRIVRPSSFTSYALPFLYKPPEKWLGSSFRAKRGTDFHRTFFVRWISPRRKPKKREIPHSADSVRNDEMARFPQFVKPRSTSKVALLRLAQQMFRGAPGERHDGERGILVGIGHQ